MSQNSATATVGGKVGPALTVTSLAVPNVQSLTLNFAASRGTITWYPTGSGVLRTLDFDLILTTTLTDTISSLVNTLVVSGS